VLAILLGVDADATVKVSIFHHWTRLIRMRDFLSMEGDMVTKHCTSILLARSLHLGAMYSMQSALMTMREEFELGTCSLPLVREDCSRLALR